PLYTNPNVQLLSDVNTNFNKLLDHLKIDTKPPRTHIFDHTYTKKHESLSSSLTSLHPSAFANPRHPELLDAVRAGLQGFVQEMERVYVNGYDGGEDIIIVDARNQKVTDDGKKCAKVCLTLFSTLHHVLSVLRKYCYRTCKYMQINKSTELGSFFSKQGYCISDRGEQNGELQDKISMQGTKVHSLLAGQLNTVYNSNKGFKNALEKLNDYLTDYYQVRHISTFTAKRRPCNVFEMLCWLSGLPCNAVYEDMLSGAVSDLFEDPSKQVAVEDEGHEITVSDMRQDSIPAHPYNMSYDDTQKAITRLCSKSYDVLARILGTGDAYSMYAVDYCSNALNLHYPPKGEDCLQLLLDVLHRLLPSLRFLYRQCGVRAAYYGWADCHYGKQVGCANWPCKDHPTNKAACEPNGQATCQANSQPNCRPTSPLMSYLNDCLPGHLPHQLRTIGCKTECATCPKSKPGMSCLVPLGFRRFSGQSRTGKELCDTLENFFSNSYITTLFCLMPKPPSTLAEHMSFAMNYFGKWQTDTSRNINGLQVAFEKSMKKLSIHQVEDASNLRSALRDIYGTKHNNEPSKLSSHQDSKHADLWSVCLPNETKPCSDLKHQCAPYISSTSSDAYNYLAEKHSDLYLSWAIYLPWTFYSCLKSLLDAFQQIDCGSSGCTKCSCKPGTHGVELNCTCNALISCRGVTPTFYQYGFTFGYTKSIYGTDRKYCRNFNTQLSNVLKSDYFTKLFEECDNFLWIIRAPFSYLVLALWLLSFLYLLHIMVIRLDLLHIKSHLHSPSSHRIAAQSLLAAGRVNKLGKVFYLQP
ncbi:hypothetical protein, conserved, partial [Babesia bigemina]